MVKCRGSWRYDSCHTARSSLDYFRYEFGSVRKTFSHPMVGSVSKGNCSFSFDGFEPGLDSSIQAFARAKSRINPRTKCRREAIPRANSTVSTALKRRLLRVDVCDARGEQPEDGDWIDGGSRMRRQGNVSVTELQLQGMMHWRE